MQDVDVDLSKVDVQVDDKHTIQFRLMIRLKFVMKYPTIDSLAQKIIVK